MKKYFSPLWYGYLLLVSNIILFFLKILAFTLSNSIAILSDAINSLTDSIASIAVAYSIKIGRQKADDNHPFGHERIEPLAALFVAVITAWLALDILKNALDRLWNPQNIVLHPFSIGVIFFTIALKGYLFFSLKKVSKTFDSPSLEAGSIDARNDMFVSFIVLIGLLASFLDYHMLDSIAAILLGFWILRTAYILGKKNVDYLTGKKADPEIVEQIRLSLHKITDISRVVLIKTHHVGHKIQVEITISIPNHFHTAKIHALSHLIEEKILTIPSISKVFIHTEPNT